MALVAVIGLLLGCGGSDEGGVDRGGAGMSSGGGPFDAGSDPNRNQVSAGSICERIATIQCAGGSFCCDSPTRTFDGCKSVALSTCQGSFAFDEVAGSAAVAFDGAAASTLFTEFERRSSMCDPAIAEWAASPVGFATSFQGTLGADADCRMGIGEVNEATTAQLGVALASCRIGDGLACLPGEAAWTCKPRGAAGSPCFTDLNCADGMYCQNTGGPYDGVCAARKPAGEACDSPIECSSFLCMSDVCAASTDVQAAYCF
jgi:hypothetical protein